MKISNKLMTGVLGMLLIQGAYAQRFGDVGGKTDGARPGEHAAEKFDSAVKNNQTDAGRITEATTKREGTKFVSEKDLVPAKSRAAEISATLTPFAANKDPLHMKIIANVLARLPEAARKELDDNPDLKKAAVNLINEKLDAAKGTPDLLSNEVSDAFLVDIKEKMLDPNNPNSLGLSKGAMDSMAKILDGVDTPEKIKKIAKEACKKGACSTRLAEIVKNDGIGVGAKAHATAVKAALEHQVGDVVKNVGIEAPGPFPEKGTPEQQAAWRKQDEEFKKSTEKATECLRG